MQQEKTNENVKRGGKNIRIAKLPKGRIIPLKRDFMFTQIFNDENYNFVLYQLLADILDTDKEMFVDNIRYLNRDLKNSNKRNMVNKVDLLIKHKIFSATGKDKEEYINVEINTSEVMLDRNKVYSNKIGSYSLDVGDKGYKNIDRIIQLNFNFFDTDKLRLLAISQMKDQDNIVDRGWNDMLYTISVNLALDSWYNLRDEREKKAANWCILMSTEDLATFKRKAEEIMSKEEADKLTSRVEELSDDKENIALYTKLTNDEMVFNTRLMNAKEEAEERGHERGIEQGIEQGIERGSKEKALEIAKKCLEKGMPSNTISELTNLAVAEIEKLK